MTSAADMSVLVDAAWVADHLGDADVRVIEVDVSPVNYNKGHIRGAVLWNAYADLRDAGYRPRPRTDLEHLVSQSGIGPDTTVVFYGYGAFLGFWLMKAHGHQHVRVFAGNRDGWEQHGGEWSTDVPAPPATSYQLPPPNPRLLATRGDVAAAIQDAGSRVLDVRSDAEFRGERFWPSGATEGAGRAGHIPAAVHVPIDLARDDAGATKGAEELRRLYAGSGISPGQRVIIYCTIGNRASFVWFVLAYLLDYPDVAVYEGSYVEWGKLPDTAIELGTD